MSCELFSNSVECDISNSLTLFIEIILGIVIAVSIFLIQIHKRQKRSEVFMTIIVSDLMSIHLDIQKLRKDIFIAGGRNDYDQTIPEEKFDKFRERWKRIQKNSEIINFRISGSSDVLKEQDLLDLQTIVYFLKQDIGSNDKTRWGTSMYSISLLDEFLITSGDILKKYEKVVKKRLEHVNSKIDVKIRKFSGSNASDIDLRMAKNWEKRKEKNIQTLKDMFEGPDF